MIPLDVSPSQPQTPPLESPSIILILKVLLYMLFLIPQQVINIGISDCDDVIMIPFGMRIILADLKRRNLASSCSTFKRRHDQGDPHVGPLGQPSGKYDYLVSCPRCPSLRPKTISTMSLQLLHVQCIQAALVQPLLQAPSPEDFPPLTPFTENASHTWKIKNPTTVDPTGAPSKLSPSESVLNWQSQNAVAQNSCLQRIESQLSTRLQSQEDNLAKLRAHINSLHHEILSLIQNRQDFSQQEQEIKFLRTQLDSLEQSQQAVRPRHDSTLSPIWTPSSQKRPSQQTWSPRPSQSSNVPPTPTYNPTPPPKTPRNTTDQPGPSSSAPSPNFMMSSSGSNPITDFLTHHTATDLTPIQNLPIHYTTLKESSSSEDSDETSSTESDSPVVFMNQAYQTPPAPPEPIVEDPPRTYGAAEPPTYLSTLKHNILHPLQDPGSI
ncbi:hypothetical protein Patl1_15627 [Pistacia atlantica]|uniref:Uncharacterized protein n=1 Tax=Pistacia atlantica TaxID=434234 RepID=A0ACC1BAW5_9ROSI|nr:hypothetical protein Patl1_15627 [Pistacia atlantica]